MLMIPAHLSRLEGWQLKKIAFRCGLQVSGTKAILAQRLQDEVPLTSDLIRGPSPDGVLRRALRPHMKIVSIDMGIRNLAYCVLDVPAGHGLPKLMDWKRIAVSSAPISRVQEEGVDVKAAKKESFEPNVLSAAAYTLLRHKLLLHNPTHILIERQRFRSMGSPQILEWTVRVNTLESMFYGVLHTLKQEGLWKGEVVPIAPGKVGPFWIKQKPCEPLKPKTTGEVEEEAEVEKLQKKTKSSLAKIKNKYAKIDMVRYWLASGRSMWSTEDMFELASDDVRELKAAYLEKWERKPGSPKGKRVSKDVLAAEEKMGKLDDLADCLLQGMAFVTWEENKLIARDSLGNNQRGSKIILDLMRVQEDGVALGQGKFRPP